MNNNFGYNNGYNNYGNAKGYGKGYEQQGNGFGNGYGNGFGNGYGQNNGYRNNYTLPELMKTGSGFSYRGDEKVKVVLDAPIGEALMTGRADAEFLPMEYMKRLREVLPIIPLHASEEDWNTWKGLATQGGKVFPGKTVDDLWLHAGMPINKKRTVDSVASEMKDLLAAAQTAQTAQMSELNANLSTLATALQAQATANANADTDKRRKVATKKK